MSGFDDIEHAKIWKPDYNPVLIKLNVSIYECHNKGVSVIG